MAGWNAPKTFEETETNNKQTAKNVQSGSKSISQPPDTLYYHLLSCCSLVNFKALAICIGHLPVPVTHQLSE